MEKGKIKEYWWAVFAGLRAGVFIALLLSPIVLLVFLSLFSLNFGGAPTAKEKLNDAIIIISFYSALFVSGFTGGYYAARAYLEKPFLPTLFLIGACLLGCLIFVVVERQFDEPMFILYVPGSISVGLFSGSLCARYRKAKLKG